MSKPPISILRHLSSAAFVAAMASALSAQSSVPSVSASSRLATRTSLEEAAVEFDRLAASPAYAERTRARARTQAVALRHRLTAGDYRVGDRLVLHIEGQLMLDDTVTVTDGPRIVVRGFRSLDLAGVLRSEVETKLRTELAENLRNVTVSVRSLMRVAVFGSVGNPGYQSVPAETTLDQLVMRAGGFAPTAAADQMILQRADTVLLRPDAVTSSVAQGLTLGALGVLDGDALVVPVDGAPWDRNAVLQIASFLLGVVALVVIRR